MEKTYTSQGQDQKHQEQCSVTAPGPRQLSLFDAPQECELLAQECELLDPIPKPASPEPTSSAQPSLTKQTNRYSNMLAGSAPADSRRKRPEDKTSWTVTECWDLHAQIKRRIFLGQKNTEIAESLNCDKQTVSLVRNSPVVQEQLAELHEKADEALIDVRREITAKAPRALEVLSEIMDNGDKDSVRVACARDLLDRAGHKAVEEVHFKDDLKELPRELLRALIDRLKNSGQVVSSQGPGQELRRLDYGQ